MNLFQQSSGRIVEKLEICFERLGRCVALYPFTVILASIFITGLCFVGIFKIRTESRGNKLWLSPESNFNRRQDWLNENFKINIRKNFFLFKAENVLTPVSLRKMFEIHKSVHNIEINEKKFKDLCARVSIADIFQVKKRRKRQSTANNEERIEEDYDYGIWYGDYDEYDGFDYMGTTDPSGNRINFKKYSKKENKTADYQDTIDSLPAKIYCDLVNTLNSKCLESSILEIWQYREDLINTATQQEIIDAVNLLVRSPWYGYDKDFSKTLGGIERNSTGHIVAAKSELIMFFSNFDDDDVDKSKGGGAEFEFVDETTLAWESKFIQLGLNSSTSNYTVMVESPRSFSDISDETALIDSKLMIFGYIIMFIYTLLMLGKIDWKEIRIFLTIAGLLSVAMGMGIAIGISAFMGYPYTPVNVILPFICLGIGIDDMFVICQCWMNMKKDPAHVDLTLADQMGVALKHAGVSITITTITDIFAFGVGAFSEMPGLQSFCVVTALALGAIYLLQITWFVAFISLDEKRIESNRNGCLPCIVHTDVRNSSKQRKDYAELIMKKYNKLLNNVIFKVSVVVTSTVLIIFGIWGCLNIREQFDFMLLLPEDSYLRQWHSAKEDLYPQRGWKAEIYSGEINHLDLFKFENLSSTLNDLEKSGKYIGNFDDWWTALKVYSIEEKKFTNWQDFATPDDFPILLSKFLFSQVGSRFKDNFKFYDKLICNEAVPKIKSSRFELNYLYSYGTGENIPAKQKVEELIQHSGIPGGFSFSYIYLTWETEEIIGHQLRQNIGLGLAFVFVVAAVMMANLIVCCMIFTTVTLTLIDIIGFLYFWNINIDIISCIYIVLSIGLCVDYAVHVGHAYLIQKGSRIEKAAGALVLIGPAVLNGGFTTFLALMLTGFSKSYIFISFFKVFFLTVTFGLFHGLVLFPVMLIVAGPNDDTEPSN